MRSRGWNSTWAPTDEVYRVHKYTSTREQTRIEKWPLSSGLLALQTSWFSACWMTTAVQYELIIKKDPTTTRASPSAQWEVNLFLEDTF